MIQDLKCILSWSYWKSFLEARGLIIITLGTLAGVCVACVDCVLFKRSGEGGFHSP